MAYVKKMTGEEFSYTIIDFMLKKYNIDHNYIKNLPKKPNNPDDVDSNIEYQDGWYQRYTFDSFEEYLAYKEFFYEKYKEFKPKSRWRKRDVEEYFHSFDLMYGLKLNYGYDEHSKRVDENDTYSKIFGKK